MFLFGVIAIEVWHTQMPIWAFMLALAICKLTFMHDSDVFIEPFSLFL